MVSVIIPTHNRCEMLKRAIESVNIQESVTVEIIVIDDLSTDDTSEVIPSFENVHYLRNETNLGPGKSRQRGYLEAKGDFVVFLDDDDYYTDCSYFRKAVNILKRDPSLSFVAGNSTCYHVSNDQYTHVDLGIHGTIKGLLYFEHFMIDYQKPTSTFPSVFRKEILDRADFKNMAMMNDSSIYLRALLFGDAFILQDNVGVYTIHETNISKSISLPFLYENLYEKLFILSLPQCRIKNPKEWWYHHYKLTYSYFMDSNHELKQELSMLRWGLHHLNGSFRLLFFISTKFLKFPFRACFTIM